VGATQDSLGTHSYLFINWLHIFFDVLLTMGSIKKSRGYRRWSLLMEDT
jgi:hypothetical protein